MKLKSKLQIITILTVIFTIVVGVILLSLSQQMAEHSQNERRTDEIHKGVFELNLLTYDYLLHKEERAKIQWFLKYDSITELLAKEDFDDKEKQLLLDGIHKNHENIKPLFLQLVDIHEKQQLNGNDLAASDEVEQKLIHQLFVLSMDMVSDASKLNDIIHTQSASSRHRTDLFVILLVIVMSSLITLNLFMFNKSIVNPILKLQEETEIIGAGNLEHRTGIDSNDEIGQLSRAFDGMLQNLKITTTSRDELNKEIIERKKAEEEIVLHSEIMKNMSEGVYLVGFEDVIIRFTNPKFEEMFGYNPGEMIGKYASIVNAPTDKDPEKTAGEIMDVIYKTGQWEGEVNNIKKDGTHFWCFASVSVIDTTKYGKVLVAVHTDITEHKQAENELKEYRDNLEELVKERTADSEDSRHALISLVEDLGVITGELQNANERLQELDLMKSMFIASTSHELRTPLNSIIGFTSVLLEGWSGDLNPEQKEQLGIVLTSGKHLLLLINDVIDISKIEAGKLEIYTEQFNLGDVVNEAASLIKTDIEEKGLVLTVDVPEITIDTDRRRLLQCIINLLSNAMKFTEKGGITIEAKTINNVVDISINDTGIGIKEEDLPKLFNAFVRLESPLTAMTSGTGLGLYLTDKLAHEVLGGTIDATSKYGEGSTFTLHIPVTQGVQT